MSKSTTSSENAWTTGWLDDVACGKSKMSQRKVSSIETKGGGLAVVKREALKRGVHLVRLEDEKGNDLVAASKKPFTVIT